MRRLLYFTTLAFCVSPVVAQRSVEYFWDHDPGIGKGQVLRQFSATQAIAADSLDVGQLAPGIHILGLRTLNVATDKKETTGNYDSKTGDDKTKVFCSTTYTRAFFIPARAEQIIRLEYSWDSDTIPGRGKSLQFRSVETKESVSLSSELPTEQLTPGLHTFYVRAVSTGHYSTTYSRLFYIPNPNQEVTRMEYSLDSDVTPGQGIPLKFTTSKDSAWYGPDLTVSNLSAGVHTLHLRVFSNALSSETYTRTFYVPAEAHEIEAVEYFYDHDPGVGRAERIAASLAQGEETLLKAFEVNTYGLKDGIHTIGIRTLTNGTWSETKSRRFLVQPQADNYVTHLEYFWNEDPGVNNGYVVDITPGEEISIDFEADMIGLGPGPHTLGLRAQSGSQCWSPVKYVSGIEFEGWENLQEHLTSLDDTQDSLAFEKYTRQYKNTNWQALYVPFTLNYSDWCKYFDVARINAFYQYDDDEDGVIDRQVLEAILVKTGNGSLKANHPYLIRAKQKGTYTFNVGSNRMAAQEINSVSCSTVEAKYTFTGNYSQLRGLNTAQYYRLRGGELSVPDNDEEVLPPYRWYLAIDDLGNQLLPSATRRIQVRVIGEEDVNTGIEEQSFPVNSHKIYDLQGRMIENGTLRRGIYIINNKKYIIK